MKQIAEKINKQAIIIRLIRNTIGIFLKQESLDKLIKNIINSRCLDFDIQFNDIAMPNTEWEIK